MAIKVLTLDGLKYYHGKIKELLAGKVDKVEGKQLSTEDYTTAEKSKLSGIATGAQVNVIESVKVGGTALAIEGKAVNIDLSDYALKTDVASALEWKGVVATVSALPTGAELGDMYHVSADGGEYIWDGSKWESAGSIVDLSNYYTKAQVDAAIDADVKVVSDALAQAKTDISAEIDGDVAAAKTELTTEINKKANSADVYTKAQVDSAIDADVAVVDGRITTEVEALEGAIALKMNSADLVAITNGEIDTAMTA